MFAEMELHRSSNNSQRNWICSYIWLGRGDGCSWSSQSQQPSPQWVLPKFSHLRRCSRTGSDPFCVQFLGFPRAIHEWAGVLLKQGNVFLDHLKCEIKLYLNFHYNSPVAHCLDNSPSSIIRDHWKSIKIITGEDPKLQTLTLWIWFSILGHIACLSVMISISLFFPW